MTAVAVAAAAVPESHYTHHPERGETPHRSNPVAIQRELTALDVRTGNSVLEIGTGSGYSSAIMAALAGSTGRITSLDVNDHLVAWANLIHHERGLGTIACYQADGTAGYPDGAPYDRIVAWCSPPLLPQSWIDQIADQGRIVVALPTADVANLTLIATITVTAGQPHVDAVIPGGYIETSSQPRTDFTLPGRWVDWSTQRPAAAWTSIGWRASDDQLRRGARATLNRLLADRHTETYAEAPLDWESWEAFAAATASSELTTAELRGQQPAIGFTTPTSAAVIQPDGKIIADSVGSASLGTLRARLAEWEAAGRPAAESFTAHLVRQHIGGGPDGWHMRLAQ